MSRWTPCKRGNFIKKLKQLGFNGPYAGTRHQFMVYQKYRLTIPSNDEYSVSQLKMMIREVEEIINCPISLDKWMNL